MTFSNQWWCKIILILKRRYRIIFVSELPTLAKLVLCNHRRLDQFISQKNLNLRSMICQPLSKVKSCNPFASPLSLNKFILKRSETGLHTLASHLGSTSMHFGSTLFWKAVIQALRLGHFKLFISRFQRNSSYSPFRLGVSNAKVHPQGSNTIQALLFTNPMPGLEM